MKFATLADAQAAYTKLQCQVERLVAIQSANTLIFSALISKHHDYDQLQLALTCYVEIAAEKQFGNLSVPAQKAARDYIEHLQSIREIKGKFNPLRR